MLTRRQSFPPPVPLTRSASLAIILPILFGIALLIAALCTLRWYMMRSIATLSGDPADGSVRAHDLEMSAAALSIGGDMMMPLPLYERYGNGRGGAGSEVTLVEGERRHEIEQQVVLEVPPPAYHAEVGGAQGHDVGEMGKCMNAERCA